MLITYQTFYYFKFYVTSIQHYCNKNVLLANSFVMNVCHSLEIDLVLRVTVDGGSHIFPLFSLVGTHPRITEWRWRSLLAFSIHSLL